jgi:hypothetical protein
VDPAALGAADSPDPSDLGSGGGYSAGSPDDQQNQNQPGEAPSQYPVDINDSLGAVQDAYASLKDSMLHGGGQQAANIPTVPAGPGGDTPSTNPFPTKNPAIPFGRQASNIPTVPAGPGGDQPNPNPFPTKTPAVPFGQKQGAIPDDQDQEAA